MAAKLVELRLPAFKSLKGASIPLDALTLLVGRNGSGKSNILDALAVLSSLASGANIRDALDGGRDGPAIRGGSEGCAPVGDDSFEMGCTVAIDNTHYHLDLTIAVRPSVQVISECLWTRRRGGQRRGQRRDLLKSDPAHHDSGDLVARWDNAKRGMNPSLPFRATQLLTTQIPTRLPATSRAGREIHAVAEQVLEALGSVFILDPVPHQMREYVPEKDTRLRRNADNLSPVLAELLRHPPTRDALIEMTRSLSEAQVSELSTVTSELGDVMVTVNERIGDAIEPMPARLMSDGTLRFLAIAAALMDAPGPTHPSSADSTAVAGRLLVVEELENGLHPSQATLLLDRLKEASRATNVRTLATTHSPAILDALSGSDHSGVLVCSRGPDGWSRVTRLTEFPDYFEVVGQGPLGAAAVKDRLRPTGGSDSAAASGPSLGSTQGCRPEVHHPCDLDPGDRQSDSPDRRPAASPVCGTACHRH